MDNLQRLLTDPEVTDFVVVAIPKSEHNPNPNPDPNPNPYPSPNPNPNPNQVAIPSRLSVAESARLLSSLVSQDVPVSQLVVNQIITEGATAAYLGRVVKEQQRALKSIDSGSSPLARLGLGLGLGFGFGLGLG